MSAGMPVGPFAVPVPPDIHERLDAMATAIHDRDGDELVDRLERLRADGFPAAADAVTRVLLTTALGRLAGDRVGVRELVDHLFGRAPAWGSGPG